MTNAERQVEALLAEVGRLLTENEELRQEIERLRKWAEDEEWLRLWRLGMADPGCACKCHKGKL